MGKIKSCVSLYSLQYEYMHGRLDLEGLFGFLRENGVDAVELLPDQMLHGAPFVSDADVANWHRLLDEYGMTPVCDDIFMNTNLYHNRTLRKPECVQMLTHEIELAHRLGFPLIRLVSMVPADMIEPVLPVAEKYNITLALEIHAGLGFDVPKTQEFIAEMKRLDSPLVGLVIDTSLFCRRAPRVVTEYLRAQGLTQPVIDYVQALYDAGSDPRRMLQQHGGIPDELSALFQGEADLSYIQNTDGYENLPFHILDEYLPYIKHVHAKLYEMTDDGVEYSIDYKGLIEYLDAKGYEGYLATEYEGNRWTLPGEPTCEREQVAAHQKMIRQYLSELGERRGRHV